MSKLKSILIAEDEPDTANLLQFHLQRRGYHTTVASDGLNALNLSFERHPDLVILDLMLPKMHGFEVCRMLKASPTTRHIPVFMLTAAASTENKVQGFSLGANDLMARIESLLKPSLPA